MKAPTNKSNNINDLSTFALFSLIFGSMMGSGVFDVPGNIAHSAGLISVIISWLITGIGMLTLGWALIYITIKRPDIQSGIYGYARYGFGSYFGFNAAYGYWLNAVLANTSYLVYVFATLGDFALFKFFGDGSNLNSIIIESLLIWIIYFLVSRGIKEASLINIIITTIKLVALFILVILFIYGFHWYMFLKNLHEANNFGSTFNQIKSTMLVTVWDFTGIEAACIYALRAKNMKDVAKATMWGGILVFLLLVLISILPFGILPDTTISALKTPSTAGVLSTIVGSFSADLIRVAIIISVLGALLAWTMLATNILYVAAEDKTLPKTFTKLNSHMVPKNSLLASTIATQLFLLFAFYTNSVYLTMIILATSMILIPYLFAGIFAFKLVILEKKFDLLNSIKGSIAVIYGVWLIYSGGLSELILSTILYSGGSILYLIARKEQKLKIFDLHELVLFLLLLIAAITSIIFKHYKLIG